MWTVDPGRGGARRRPDEPQLTAHDVDELGQPRSDRLAREGAQRERPAIVADHGTGVEDPAGLPVGDQRAGSEQGGAQHQDGAGDGFIHEGFFRQGIARHLRGDRCEG